MARLRALLPLAMVAMLVLGACDDESEAAPGALLELAVRLDEARIAGGVPGVGPIPDATPDDADDAPPSLIGVATEIGATGGDGVSLRSACRTDARIDGGWADGTEVVVIELGADSCEGWSRVQAAGLTSWVSNQYLPGLASAAGPGTPGEAPAAGVPDENPEAAAIRNWSAALDEASSRVALVARTATGSSMPHQAAFLDAIDRDLGALEASVANSGMATGGGACGAAAAALTGAAATLRGATAALATLFADWPESSYPAEVDGLASRYTDLVAGAAVAVASCLDTADVVDAA